MLDSVVDDRSGVVYPEYHEVYQETLFSLYAPIGQPIPLHPGV